MNNTYKLLRDFVEILFTKKEPELYWGDFKEYECCKECNHLKDFNGEFDFICPKCGSKEEYKVVARWQSYHRNAGLGLMRVVRVKYEIRKDK